jgi:hypothetical protein
LTHYTSQNRSIHAYFVESHEHFFSHLATFISTGDRGANLDLCLALAAFSSYGSFTCHTYCDMGSPFLRWYPKDLPYSLLNAMLLANEQSLTILKVLGLTQQAEVGLELTTSRMISDSTTTSLLQPLSHWDISYLFIHVHICCMMHRLSYHPGIFYKTPFTICLWLGVMRANFLLKNKVNVLYSLIWLIGYLLFCVRLRYFSLA